MRTAIVLVLLLGCEPTTGAPRAPKPVVVVEEPKEELDWEDDEDEEQPRGPHRHIPEPPERYAHLPTPPTDEPVAYQAWFAALPRTTKREINSACRRFPTSYQYVCGGVGHLHIPLPPGRRPASPTRYFETTEAWRNSLTAAQKRYIDRYCAGELWSRALCR